MCALTFFLQSGKLERVCEEQVPNVGGELLQRSTWGSLVNIGCIDMKSLYCSIDTTDRPSCKCSCGQCGCAKCGGQAVEAARQLFSCQAVVPGGWGGGTPAWPDEPPSWNEFAASEQQHLCKQCPRCGNVPSDYSQQCQGPAKLKRERSEERLWRLSEGVWEGQKPEGPVHVRRVRGAEADCEKGCKRCGQ